MFLVNLSLKPGYKLARFTIHTQSLHVLMADVANLLIVSNAAFLFDTIPLLRNTCTHILIEQPVGAIMDMLITL